MDHGLNDVRHWLSSFHLQDYTRVFIENGFTSLKTCSVLNEAHLNQLHIPKEYHHALLTGARNLQLNFPNHIVPDVNEDVPPPLPEKKSRRSLPSPAPRAKREGRIAAQNRNSSNVTSPKPTRHPPAVPSTVPPIQVAPPSAPPRRSVLRKSMTSPQDAPIQKKNASVESNRIDVLPPPCDPLNDDLIDLSSHIPESPRLPAKKNRKASARTDDICPAVNIVVNDSNNDLMKDFSELEIASDDHYVTQPPTEPTATIPSPKKVKPPIKPRPTITPRPTSVCKSPTPLRASMSNTLPLPTAEGIYHDNDSGPKSATLPNTKVCRALRCS